MYRRKVKRRNQQVVRPIMILGMAACMAVGTGYLGVKYVVSPWMEGQNVPVSNEVLNVIEDIPMDNTAVVEDTIDAVITEAYAVQMGSFSSREAAEQKVKELEGAGIQASIQERDNAWKVVAGEFSTKEEARAAAIGWRDIVGDAFVVGI